MLERLRRVGTSLNAQPIAVKVILIVIAFALLILLSRVLAGLAGLVLLVSLVAVVIRLFRRRSLRGWGIVALASLASIVVFTGIANAVYGPPEQPTREQAVAPGTVTEEKEASKTTQEEAAKETTPPETTEETAASKPPTASSEPDEEAAQDQDEDGQGRYDAITTVTQVIDGDTIEISPAVDGNDEVRLIGVDTPETWDPDCGAQPLSEEAEKFTTSELQGQEVELEFDEDRTDRYDRLLAYVYEDGEMFNETLLREGYAQVYTVPPNDKYEDRLEEAQEEAQAANLGIWGLSPEEQGELADRDNGIGGSGCAAEPEPEPEPEPQPEPDLVPESDVPSAPVTPTPPVGSGKGGRLTCADFSTEAEASAAIPANPQLDRDGNGRACESLP